MDRQRGRRRRRRELSWPWTSSCCVRPEHRLLIGTRQRNGPGSTEGLSVQSFKLLTLLSADAFCFLLSMLREGGRRRVQTAECRGWWAMAWQHGGEPGPGRGSFIGRGRRCRLVLLCSVGARNREGRGKEAGYGCLGDAHATPLAACHRPPALCQSSQRICAALSLSLYIPGLLVPLAETSALHTYIKSIL